MRTDADLIERSFAIAFDVGKMPDAKIDADAVRISVLRNTLRKACEKHKANSCGGTKLTRNDH